MTIKADTILYSPANRIIYAKRVVAKIGGAVEPKNQTLNLLWPIYRLFKINMTSRSSFSAS